MKIAKNPFLYFYLILTFSIFRGLQSRFLIQNGDAAGFVDALSPGQSLFDLNFIYGLSIFKLKELLAAEPSDLTVIGFENHFSEISFFHSHPYVFSFIFRLIPTFGLPIYFLPLLLLASSYAIGLTLITNKLVKSKLNVIVKFILVMLALTTPILTEAVSGQPYFDKLFFGPCIAIVFLIQSSDLSFQRNRLLLYTLILISITLSERTSLIVFIIVSYLFVQRFGFKKFFAKQNFNLLLLVFAALAWFIIWTKFISVNPDMDNLNFRYYWENLSSAIVGSRQSEFILFLLFTAPFIVLSSLRLTYLPLSLIVLMPNILVSIGGAELSGYSTHYHSIYLPVIIALSVLSATEPKNSRHEPQSTAKQILIGLVGLVGIGLLCLYPQNRMSLSNFVSNFQSNIKLGAEALGVIPQEILRARSMYSEESLELFRKLSADREVRVSAPERFMPSLAASGFRLVDYFPVGVGVNEIIIVPFTDSTFRTVEISLYGLVPEANRNLWSDAILLEVQKRYVMKFKSGGYFGNYAIYEKKSAT